MIKFRCTQIYPEFASPNWWTFPAPSCPSTPAVSAGSGPAVTAFSGAAVAGADGVGTALVLDLGDVVKIHGCSPWFKPWVFNGFHMV